VAGSDSSLYLIRNGEKESDPFSDMNTCPQSPKEMTSGMYFPRMLDKIRLHARGQLAEDYHANLG
jgi:hypothetical protein